ncbi:MAG: YceI family protein [Rickettsiales bacterium]|nr:YceI family protein [Rickettsiales bacterium]
MKKLLSAFLILFSFSANAEQPVWKIIPAQSKLEFKVEQDGSVINGSFKKFDGKIIFDKAKLDKSKVAIEVDVSSIALSFADAIGTVQSPEWLSTKAFPKAIFNAEKFSASGKSFRANGNLTIKGKTVPTILEFYFKDYSEKKAIAEGKLIIKRSSFGIGSSDIKKSNGVKDEVEITFEIAAEK